MIRKPRVFAGAGLDSVIRARMSRILVDNPVRVSAGWRTTANEINALVSQDTQDPQDTSVLLLTT